MSATKNKVRVKLVRSPIGKKQNHRKCVTGLGLRKMHQVVELEDNPVVRGLINKINYMLEVEEVR